MIFVMKYKTFNKISKKILPAADYLIVDGNDLDSEISTNADKALSANYTNVYTNGTFTPPKSLIRDLTDIEEGAPIRSNARKIEDKLKDYLKSEDMTLSITATVNTINVFDDPRSANVFIVLPNKVYRAVGEDLTRRIKKLFKTDFDFIFNDDEILKNKKLAKKKLKKNQVKEIKKLVSANVDKYGLEGKKKKKKKKDKDKKKKKKQKCSGSCKDCMYRYNCEKKKKKHKKAKKLSKYLD